MSYYLAFNELPLVYVFRGEQPADVMKEAAKFLRKAAKRNEFLTSWNIQVSEDGWVGTLVTNGAGK